MADDVEKQKKKRDALKVPAVYVDDFYTLWWRGHLRITFGEETDDVPIWRTALLLELNTAKLLVGSLSRMIARLEELEKNNTNVPPEFETPKDVVSEAKIDPA